VTTKTGETEVNVRSGPATTAPVIGKLQAGEEATALGRTQGTDWIQIEFPKSPDGKAWVNINFIDLSAVELPITDSGSGEVSLLDPAKVTPNTGRPEAVEALQLYLKNETLSYVYLGPDVNLNSPSLSKVDRYIVDEITYSIDWEIDSTHSPIASGAALTPGELEQIAVKLVSDLTPGININSFGL
jgi:hypothetical protein